MQARVCLPDTLPPAVVKHPALESFLGGKGNGVQAELELTLSRPSSVKSKGMAVRRSWSFSPERATTNSNALLHRSSAASGTFSNRRSFTAVAINGAAPPFDKSMLWGALCSLGRVLRAYVAYNRLFGCRIRGSMLSKQASLGVIGIRFKATITPGATWVGAARQERAEDRGEQQQSRREQCGEEV